MKANVYINPNAPEYLKKMLEGMFEENDLTPNTEFNDDKRFFECCSVCGKQLDVLRIGKFDFHYCEEHKSNGIDFRCNEKE